jgi:ribosome-associated heat shock protein Hsp15
MKGLAIQNEGSLFLPRPSPSGYIVADQTVRLDRWLWASRFFKTRALAVQAIDGGRVQVGGQRVKRAKAIRVGDRIRIRQGPYEWRVVVQGLSERRGPASAAAELYEETPDSKVARERLAERLKSAPPPLFSDKGRPSKKERRALERLKRQLGEE